jgi:cytochrome P450 family 142 subfamily A polypeptide 1
LDLNIEFLASQNWDETMAERLAWLREHEPVHWSDKDQLWVVTRFEDVAYVSKHQELFTSSAGVRPGNPAKLGLIDEDEPRHTQLRKLINKGFSPRMVKKLEDVFRAITTEAIDGVAGSGECDFVTAISVPLPIRLIAAMMGIREQDRDLFHRWSDEMIAADGNQSDPEIMLRAHKAFIEYSAYVTQVIEDRRAHPQDDLVSILVGAKDEGLLGDFGGSELRVRTDVSEEHLALANDELIMLMVVLMVAGNETTRNGISGGMQLLIENPGERRKLIDDPSRIPAAVEEMLRLTSPVRSFGRTATQDTELRGVQILKGQKVLIVYPAANRDPEEFPEPDRFDVSRNPHHLSFGIGSHFCLGANLARMEMRVAFEEVLRRLPDMEYSDGGPVLKPSALVRSCMQMRVRFTPEATVPVG